MYSQLVHTSDGPTANQSPPVTPKRFGTAHAAAANLLPLSPSIPVSTGLLHTLEESTAG